MSFTLSLRSRILLGGATALVAGAAVWLALAGGGAGSSSTPTGSTAASPSSTAVG